MENSKKVEILSEKQIFKKFIFRINEAKLRHSRYDGSMSEPITRLNFDRGDSVALLVHDVDEDTILLTEQFRYPAYDPAGKRGDGWIMEIPAGSIDAGEVPEDAARRELTEETGYTIQKLQFLKTFYLSPGGTSERIILYYAQMKPTDKLGAGGGVGYEGEDIKTLRVKVDDALKMIQTGEIVDAKTILALQWLQLQRMA